MASIIRIQDEENSSIVLDHILSTYLDKESILNHLRDEYRRVVYENPLKFEKVEDDGTMETWKVCRA